MQIFIPCGYSPELVTLGAPVDRSTTELTVPTNDWLSDFYNIHHCDYLLFRHEYFNTPSFSGHNITRLSTKFTQIFVIQVFYFAVKFYKKKMEKHLGCPDEEPIFACTAEVKITCVKLRLPNLKICNRAEKRQSVM